VLIVTNETVAPLYLQPLQQQLSTDFQVAVCVLPDGEQYKDLAHFYIYNGGGYDGANVINIINTQHLAPVARDIYPNAGVGTADGSVVEANWYNGTIDSDCITVANAASNCIRLCYCCLSTSNTQICVNVTRRL